MNIAKLSLNAVRTTAKSEKVVSLNVKAGIKAGPYAITYKGVYNTHG